MLHIMFSMMAKGVSTDPSRVIKRIKDNVAGKNADFGSKGDLCYGAVAKKLKSLKDTSGYTIVILGVGTFSIHGILLDPSGKVVADNDNGKWNGHTYSKSIVTTRTGPKKLPKPVVYKVVTKETL